MKYDIYVRILDEIITEAPDKYARYRFSAEDVEKRTQARARASIHLYLKVLFGALDFEDRERLLTDGAHDGGVDAYYVDSELKTTYKITLKGASMRKRQAKLTDTTQPE
jgi:hypothetical protein